MSRTLPKLPLILALIAPGLAAAAPGLFAASSVVFGAGSGKIVFNHSANGYQFAAAMTGTGAIEVVSGTTSLTGDSSGFTGITTVEAGTLALVGSGSIASSSVVTVKDDAIFDIAGVATTGRFSRNAVWR